MVGRLGSSRLEGRGERGEVMMRVGKVCDTPQFLRRVCRFFLLCLAVMIHGKELGFMCGVCEFFHDGDGIVHSVVYIPRRSPVCRGGTCFAWSLSLAPCICHLRKLGRIVYNFALSLKTCWWAMCKRGRDRRVICTIL